MMLRHIRLGSLAVLFVFLSVGCGTTDTLILSENLSSDFQVKLSTVDQYKTSFEFNPSPEADGITAESPRMGSEAAVKYSLNTPLRGKLTNLMRAKFGSITESSENKVTFTIESINTETQNEAHRVEMTSKIQIKRNGETYSRTITRSAATPITTIAEAVQPKISLEREPIEEFIMQFVVATDSYIDSNFGVD